MVLAGNIPPLKLHFLLNWGGLLGQLLSTVSCIPRLWERAVSLADVVGSATCG